MQTSREDQEGEEGGADWRGSEKWQVLWGQLTGQEMVCLNECDSHCSEKPHPPVASSLCGVLFTQKQITQMNPTSFSARLCRLRSQGLALQSCAGAAARCSNQNEQVAFMGLWAWLNDLTQSMMAKASCLPRALSGLCSSACSAFSLATRRQREQLVKCSADTESGDGTTKSADRNGQVRMMDRN